MTITVQIPPDIETQIRENASLGNTETVHRLLLDALVPTVEALMKPNPQLSVDELNALADEMGDKFMRFVGPDCLPLSDHAVSREGIYEDHRNCSVN